MASVELLRARASSETGEAILAAFVAAAHSAGDRVKETRTYEGSSDWLVLYGVGASVNDAARKAHVSRGGRVLMWDLGYWERKKIVGNLRMSIDTDHPQQWFDKTPSDSWRWEKAKIKLRSDADPNGPIILIGMGRKSRAYLGSPNWEQSAYKNLVQRFPGRRIIYRPKGRDSERMPCESDAATPIGDLLKGASLLVCRHSNCAVDATIAGVPFEAEDGAAIWLKQREFTPENRLKFLRRLAWWQWQTSEVSEAWTFAKKVVNT